MNKLLLDASPTPVPFLDLKIQDSELRQEILQCFQEIAESTRFALGPHVEEFEEAFARATGTNHCVAVNSGTSALHVALIAADVAAGDEVIIPAMTFVATAWAIRYVQAKPVFVDIDPTTYTMDVDQIESRITPRTRAILPVHLYGQPADMEPLQELASKHGLAIVEDAAQAHAATYHGKPVGSIGQSGCFSFYPGKNLGAYGEGGAVVTNDDAIASRLRSLRDHAQLERYHHQELGFNYRMDALQGAVLKTKLPRLKDWNTRRGRHANTYQTLLDDTPLTLPKSASHREHVWHLFVALHPERDQIRSFLQEHGIQTGLHYPIPLHLQPAFNDLGYSRGEFPIAERVGRECFSLPMFPDLTNEQQAHVAASISKYFDQGH